MAHRLGRTPQLRRRTIPWRDHARPSQLPRFDLDWIIRLFLAGRGWGKTRAGAETTSEYMRDHPGARGTIVGRTAADLRDIMIEGPAGIIAVAPDGQEPPRFEPGNRRILWPNGAIALTRSAEEPRGLRGLAGEITWADELASWSGLQRKDDPERDNPWTQITFGMREGRGGRIIITTTPKPLDLLREIIDRPGTLVSGGSTYDNAANLSPVFISDIIAGYEGTRIGRQEIHAELLEDFAGAYWSAALIDEHRVRLLPATFRRIVTAVDPAMTSDASSNFTGITTAGLLRRGGVDHAYVPRVGARAPLRPRLGAARAGAR